MFRAKPLRSKLWFNIFLPVAVIFVAFTLILTLCNTALLSVFFEFRQRGLLISQIERLDSIDINDSNHITEIISDINDNYNFDVEIYNTRGNILYTTHSSQMMDFYMLERDDFKMSHEELDATDIKYMSNGITFMKAQSRFSGTEFLLCQKELSNGITAEVRIQRRLVTASAQTANEFIIAVAAVCLALSVIWVLAFAKRFSKPIISMNEITRDMANLKFDRKLKVTSSDEIGSLAQSVNEMSDSLSATLEDLRISNSKLRDEIELERSLDAMRRGFVANVSHELKTPISIISGYAEGLKLNVNSSSREQYCDTIIDESRRMNDLVLSILELSRYESGQMPKNPQQFDIFAVSSQICERLFSDSGIAVENLIPKGIQAFADKTQIEQMLKAYLENAKAHTKPGGTVTLKADKKDDKLRISVRNTGENIPPNIMPSIWQSFFRGDTSHNRSEGRFGLGLSIVSAICRENGCDCGVYNTIDGVCFWFDIDTKIA